MELGLRYRDHKINERLENEMIAYDDHYAPTKVMRIDIGNLCTNCGRDTSFGTGLFVNRIPSGAGGRLVLGWQTYHEDGVVIEVEVDGYLCPECQMIECEKCGQMTNEYDGDFLCNECREKESE